MYRSRCFFTTIRTLYWRCLWRHVSGCRLPWPWIEWIWSYHPGKAAHTIQDHDKYCGSEREFASKVSEGRIETELRNKSSLYLTFNHTTRLQSYFTTAGGCGLVLGFDIKYQISDGNTDPVLPPVIRSTIKHDDMVLLYLTWLTLESTTCLYLQYVLFFHLSHWDEMKYTFSFLLFYGVSIVIVHFLTKP